MADLIPITALGGATAKTAVFGALTITEDTGLALASLARLDGAALPDLALPGPGGWAAAPVPDDGEGLAAFWTGPDQWMIEAPGRAGDDFAGWLAARAPGCAVTEQTDGWVAFDIRSSAGEAPVLRLLEKLVNLDPARLPPGSATRTGLEHMAVFVVRRELSQVAVIGMRSAAGSLWHALSVSARRNEGKRA